MAMKTVKELVTAVTLMEGKKVPVSKANVNEVINCLAKLIATDDDAHEVWCKYVLKHQPKKAKKEK